MDRYEEMIDHRSYKHNLSSCEIKAWKKFRPENVEMLFYRAKIQIGKNNKEFLSDKEKLQLSL